MPIPAGPIIPILLQISTYDDYTGCAGRAGSRGVEQTACEEHRRAPGTTPATGRDGERRRRLWGRCSSDDDYAPLGDRRCHDARPSPPTTPAASMMAEEGSGIAERVKLPSWNALPEKGDVLTTPDVGSKAKGVVLTMTPG